MVISSNECSNCCHGSFAYQCGDTTYYDNGVWVCETGEPAVIYMQGYSDETRPPYNVNYTIDMTAWMPSGCNCGCTLNADDC